MLKDVMTPRRGSTTIKATNPSTGKVVSEFDALDAQQVFLRLRHAAEAFPYWSATPFAKRAEVLTRAAAVLRERAEEYAILITREMGKPITQARAEVEKCAVGCEFFAENAEAFLSPEYIDSDASKSKVVFEPLGAILAVMPWNFPFWQVFRFAAPALMAGNVGLLKHSSDVPGCAQAIEDVFIDAGAPLGVFQNLHVGSSAVKDILKHPTVRAVSLTGSERAGRIVAMDAGAALKKCVLELGGSDPFLVLADADIEKAVDAAVLARTQNAGQSCIAAKRFLVAHEIVDEFTPRFVRAMRALRVGDPMDDATEMGPLVRADALDDLDSTVRAAIDRGAELLCGGRRMDRVGNFYEPTVLARVTPDMEVFSEETFGPVATISVFRDLEEAVELANSTRFGLGASIWTSDVTVAEQLVPRIEAGSVFVNGIVKSDPRLPFGGVKSSGYGRELSVAGIREFVNWKTVWIR